jgi:hypothetical protein
MLRRRFWQDEFDKLHKRLLEAQDEHHRLVLELVDPATQLKNRRDIMQRLMVGFRILANRLQRLPPVLTDGTVQAVVTVDLAGRIDMTLSSDSEGTVSLEDALR